MDGLRIYRGINQIGGVVTEFRKGDHRILIDFGANLPGTENAEKEDDALVKEVFSQKDVTTDAVLFTHYHGDHVGLKDRIPEGIPMYAGKTALHIMKEIAGRVDRLKEKQGRPDEAELPVLDRIEPYWGEKKWKEFSGIRVMPLVCDHSALDAYMFVIEMNGKRILYTGDFRAHGVPGMDSFESTIRENVGKVDLLVTEGTMVSRFEEEKKNKIRTEADLQAEAVKIFSKHDENVVLVSSTNTDSIMGFYHAAAKAKRAFVCDSYQAAIIQIAIDANFHKFRENYCYKGNIYVLCPEQNGFYMKDLRDFVIPGTDRKPFLMAKPELYSQKGFVMLARPNRNPAFPVGRFEARMADMREPLITYSLWKGYLKGGKAEDPAIVRFLDGHTDHMQPLHTSGHAYVEDLKKLMDMTSPDVILPMHTDSAKRFKETKMFTDYEERIRPLRVGEVYPI